MGKRYKRSQQCPAFQQKIKAILRENKKHPERTLDLSKFVTNDMGNGAISYEKIVELQQMVRRMTDE